MDAFKTIAHASEEEFVINARASLAGVFPSKRRRKRSRTLRPSASSIMTLRTIAMPTASARAGKRPVFRMTASLPAQRACP